MPPIDPHIPHIWGFFYPKILTNFTQLVRITLLFVPRFERLTMLDNFSLNIPTLIVLIFGVVEFIKSLGVSGNKLRVVSLAVGFSLAFSFQLQNIFPEAAQYIEVGFFAVAGGLTASGLYSFAAKRWPPGVG